jgi:hypothetical protein
MKAKSGEKPPPLNPEKPPPVMPENPVFVLPITPPVAQGDTNPRVCASM